ncbi:ABC transporter substrate-binding protein [Paenibacillus roseipurpureus]|uniref:ABC transporter substrate-binding protein n=1 Tax=Paenibacillus roseopurpureus TaxID=2918901 RepID=A0AA96LLT0_9BACL|nr:ABC transporter substrate-binding protein [Paenibacillus sp. MBLB1832]WNR42088.1 ABC transporter substrate-binding protein [Paenibacillus sp. MBLB1832]
MRVRHRTGWKAAVVLLVFSTFLAGCESQSDTVASDQTPNKLRITFWTPFSGGDGQFMAELIQQYNNENTDHVKIDQINNNSGDYYTKLSTAIVTEEAPDIAIVHSAKYAQYASAGFLTDLNALAAEAGVHWEDFNPTILQSTVADNKHLGIPLDTHLEVMYYNKDLLRQAGLLDEREKPVLANGEKGFLTFLETIRQHVPSNVTPLAEPNLRIDSFWLWYSFYNQMNLDGGRFYSDDGQSAAINNSSALQSLSFVNSLYTKKLILPNSNDPIQTFAKGEAATLISGVWGTGAIEKVPHLHFGVTKIPQIYDHPAVWGDSHTFSLPTHEKPDKQKQLAALKFANWVAAHGASWAKAGHIPAVKKAVASDEFQKLNYRPDYASAADDVKYFPKQPRQGTINDELVREFEKMMAGQITPQEVLQNAQKIIDDNLQIQQNTPKR